MVYEQLDGYQRRGVDHAIRVKTAAIYMEQGTGKTWVACGIIERLKPLSSLLIVPLTNKISTWYKTLLANFPLIPIVLDLAEYMGFGILLLHYEAVPPIIKRLRRHKWGLIVYDESQRLSNRGTLQSRTAAKLHDSAKYKVILTGTPIESDPQDMWAQFRFLNDSVLPDRWEDFADKFFIPLDIDEDQDELKKSRYGSFKWRRLMRKIMIAKHKRHFDMDKIDNFMDLVSPYIYEILFDDVIKVPMEIHRVPVVMRGEQRRAYDELETSLILQLERSEVTALLKVTQLVKLQQITGGYIIDDDGDTHELGRAKMIALKKLVRSQSRPLAIFARYRAEVAAIERALIAIGLRVATLTGKTKKKDRPIIQEDFQSGKYDAIVSQVRVGGVGIDLFRSACLILYSMGHSSIDFRQIVSRLRRRGQENKVLVFIIECLETIDNQFYDAVRTKRRVIDQVSIALRNQVKRRSVHHGKSIGRQRTREAYGRPTRHGARVTASGKNQEVRSQLRIRY